MITESIKNIIDTRDNAKELKLKYAEEVWDILQTSYKPIGGIKGRGFNSIEEMIVLIPFWKLFIKNGEVKTVIMYKDKNGRKSIALGTDGSEIGKKGLAMMLDRELERSYKESSGPALKFMIRNLGVDYIAKHAINIQTAEKILDKDLEPAPNAFDIPDKLKKYVYKRTLFDGSQIAKIMIGTPFQDIF